MELKVENTKIACAHLVHSACPTSKCRNVHGHNYRIDVTIKGEPTSDGMIIDAQDIKTIINELDHKFLIPKDLVVDFKRIQLDSVIKVEDISDSSESQHIISYLNSTDYIMVKANGQIMILPKSSVLSLDIPSITAEHLSEYLAHAIAHKCAVECRKASSISVTVYETETISSTKVVDIPNRAIPQYIRLL